MKIEEWIAEITEVDKDIWQPDIEADSREKVIKAGMKLAKEEWLSSFRIGKKLHVGVPTLDIDDILERVGEQVYDEVGEVAEDYLDDVTKEQYKELEEKLNEVFFQWIKKHKLEPTFYIVSNEEIIKVE